LKHPDATVATYKRKQMKHLKQASETLEITPEKHLKIIANIYSIQMNSCKHTYETLKNI
jgi:DICT domain-containing protein